MFQFFISLRFSRLLLGIFLEPSFLFPSSFVLPSSLVCSLTFSFPFHFSSLLLFCGFWFQAFSLHLSFLLSSSTLRWLYYRLTLTPKMLQVTMIVMMVMDDDHDHDDDGEEEEEKASAAASKPEDDIFLFPFCFFPFWSCLFFFCFRFSVFCLGWYFSLLDNFFLAVYFFEIAVKIYVWRCHYFASGWNQFGKQTRSDWAENKQDKDADRHSNRPASIRAKEKRPFLVIFWFI